MALTTVATVARASAYGWRQAVGSRFRKFCHLCNCLVHILTKKRQVIIITIIVASRHCAPNPILAIILTVVIAAVMYRAGGSAAQSRAGQHEYRATPCFLPGTHCGSHCQHRSLPLPPTPHPPHPPLEKKLASPLCQQHQVKEHLCHLKLCIRGCNATSATSSFCGLPSTAQGMHFNDITCIFLTVAV